jgi:hypothetical protein
VDSTLYWFDPEHEEKGQCMRWRLRHEFSFFSRGKRGEGASIIAVGALPVPEYTPHRDRPTWCPHPKFDRRTCPDYHAQEAQAGAILQSALPSGCYAGYPGGDSGP